MFKQSKNFLILDEFNSFGVEALYTELSYGNVMELTKEKFKKDFDLGNRKIVAGHQTHSSNIAIIDDKDKFYFENTDGFITARKDIVIFTKYADCLPIYLYDELNKVIGLVHSGWQGSYQEIGIEAIKLMEKVYSSKLEDIYVAFGVGISQKNYQVGEDFFLKFKEKFSEEIVKNSFIKNGEQYYFDNQKFNRLNMMSKGIKSDKIITNNLCTYDGNFHSYRRDREKSGRNGAFIYFK